MPTSKNKTPAKNKKTSKMGRPKIFDDEKDKQLRAILRLKPTLVDCAAFFDVDPSTIERYINRQYNCTYAEFRDQNMVHTRFSLIRKAIQKAEGGDNVMLIFCLKNLCGWTDKVETQEDQTVQVNVTHNQS